MSDTGLFFSESTHSFMWEEDRGISKHNYVASQNEMLTRGTNVILMGLN